MDTGQIVSAITHIIRCACADILSKRDETDDVVVYIVDVTDENRLVAWAE